MKTGKARYSAHILSLGSAKLWLKTSPLCGSQLDCDITKFIVYTLSVAALLLQQQNSIAGTDILLQSLKCLLCGPSGKPANP